MTDQPTVVQALAAVMGELPAIGRDGQASAQQGGYNYRGIEQITAAAQGLFAKHGVIFAPEVVRTETRELTVNGKPWTDTFLQVRYTVYGPGGDSITVGPLLAIGRDNSDKGANKAMTQAFKYALLQVLCISDAKDDGDVATHVADVRGVAVPDEIFWQNFGFESEEAFMVENNSLRELWRSLPDEGRPGVKAWLKDHGYHSPVPVKRENVEGYRKVMLAALHASDVESIPEPEPMKITRTTPADVRDKALQGLEAAFQSLPEGPRGRCQAEIKKTFGEYHEMEIDHIRAAMTMVADWPMADVEQQQPFVPVPPARSGKLRGLLAFARGQSVGENEIIALVSFMDNTHEPRPLEELGDDRIPEVTSLIEDLKAGKLTIENGNSGPVVREVQPA